MLGQAEPRAVAGDAEGGLVVAGDFRGPVRIDQSAIDGEGAFVLRTGPDSSVRWLRAVSGGFRVRAAAFAADGDVVIAGEAGGKCSVARLGGADGAQKWTAAMAGEASSCTTVAPGGGWVAGTFTGVVSAEIASRGLSDAFFAQLSDAGDIRLVRSFGGQGRDEPRALLALPSGDLLLGGQFGGDIEVAASAVDFGRGAVKSAGDFDGFLLALGPDAKTRWAATFGDTGDDEVTALAAGSDGAIYAGGHHQPAGEFSGLAARGVGNFTGAVLRYTPAGRGEWVRIFEGKNSSVSALAFDTAGRLWAAGEFQGDLRVGSVSIPSAGGQDLFAVALAPATGEPLGARSLGSPARERLAGVASIPGGIALAGSTRGEMPACRKLIGSPGEATGFVVWLRDLAN